ncbi:tripartite tricarboxylate transporter substrate binding protein [Acetobacteraceae bacterium H6797]|nr:tripartite tricarboxylate transporter substrate binding protein [Acetobacteraceae bacterium H6797]
MITRRALSAALLASPALTAIRPAQAQGAWKPERPIEVIVPYPPGGGIDIMARLAGKYLPNFLPGANIVVTNKVGAGGQTGSEQVFTARPDGYTLGAVATLAFSSLPHDRPVRWKIDKFSYLAQMVDDPGGFWVKKDSPFKTMADLVAAMKKAPETVSVGCAAGIGSDDHQLLLAFEEAAGVRALNVPYNGTALSIRDLLGGQIQVASYNLSEGIALYKEGQTRCLGGAGEARWEALPEVPTFKEQGFDVIGGSARGFVGPPDLPENVAATLVAAFRAMMEDKGFLEEAKRLFLPLKPLYGSAYRDSVLVEGKRVDDLFQRRPWTSK